MPKHEPAKPEKGPHPMADFREAFAEWEVERVLSDREATRRFVELSMAEDVGAMRLEDLVEIARASNDTMLNLTLDRMIRWLGEQ